jgi:hypothetical protein
MGWEKGGRYYTRSRKVNGRVVREYAGKGLVGEQAARADAECRARLQAQTESWRAEKARSEALEAEMAALEELTNLLGRAALAAAGYHQHNRGEWRRKRGQRTGCA